MKLISARHRPWVFYAAFSLLSLGVMTSNLRGGLVADRIEIIVLHILAPVYSSVNWLLNSVHSTWDNYLSLVDVRRENTNLKETIQTIQEEHLQLIDRAVSTDRLETFMDGSFRLRQFNLRAKVIRRGNTQMNPTVLIDLGSQEGIREGFGVASSTGAWGQVVRVGPNVSKVLTLHHPDAGIGAMLQKSRVQGVVSGSGKGTCTMRFISRFDPVELGETVVTSGLDGAFPKGIPIGKVSGIEKDNNEIFQTLEIETDVNLNAVEEVIVFIMPDLPPMEFSDAQSDLETSEKSGVESSGMNPEVPEVPE